MTDEFRPDPAALDELLRAFGEVPDDRDDTDDGDPTAGADTDASPAGTPISDASPSDDRPPSDDGPPSDGPSGASASSAGPEEIHIVEQEPMAPADPDPAPPAVIRIDDYSGSVVIAAEATGAGDPTGAAGDASGTAGDASGTPGGGEPADDEPPTVISIEDDALPDAVYVQGDLEGSGNRTIVFIDDDDSVDAVVPEVERDARRGIEPRMRERRAAVKRALGRKRLRWIVGVTTVVVVAVAVLAVLGSNLFAIEEDQVSIVGAVYADPEEVAAVVDDLVGTPALLVDTRELEERLAAIPWVDQARVRIDFPHAATIEIREREAMSTYQGPDQRYRVLDREGRVLDVLDGYPIAYVLIAGPDPVDLDPGQFAPQGYAAASDLAKSLTGSVRGRVAYIDVTADGSSLALQLDDGTRVRFGAARDLLDKLIRLETVLTANPDREPGTIDVSTSEVTL